MLLAKLFFFFALFVIIYAYIGYAFLIWLFLKSKTILSRPKSLEYEPSLLPVTLVVAAYNEEDFIREKIENTLLIDYPKDKLEILFITDGSTDNTHKIACEYKEIMVLHQDERKGKIAAIHRAMAFVRTPIVVFSDANTLLNPESIRKITAHYKDEKIGGVAGEKKILTQKKEKAAGAGEGLYWKYESLLKRLDASFYTVVGAAGELFSIRTELYEYVGREILLDDFVISLRVCERGFRVAYEPEAYAIETPSSSIKEEQKRKIRISAGAFQAMVKLKSLLNFFKHPLLSFQYVSHRVLRWTVCPIFVPLLFIVNFFLFFYEGSLFYILFLFCQILFYIMALLGWVCSQRNIKSKLFYAPYYFVFINLSLYLGFIRYIKGTQTVLWDKAFRRGQEDAVY